MINLELQSRTAMHTLSVITLTALATTLLVGLLRTAGRINSRGATLAARRRTGLLQLLRWLIIVVGAAAVLVEAMLAVGIDKGPLVLIGGGLVTAFALGIREPIADFLAAAALIVERTAAVGDEVEINGEVSGRLAGFGLRSVAVTTWDGGVVYVTASNIRTFRNASKGASRAVVDVDVPAAVRTGRAAAVLAAACARVADTSFHSPVEVLGVVHQSLDHYVVRLSCVVDPARHREAEYRLKAAAVDAVAELLADERAGLDTAQMLALVGQPRPA